MTTTTTTTTIPTGEAFFQLFTAGSWYDLPIATLGFRDFKYSLTENNPALLNWMVDAPEHSFPLPYKSFVRLWFHNQPRPDGSTQGPDTPLFEGFVERIEPGGESRQVKMTAIAPPYRLTNEFILMSAAYQWDGTQAVEGFAAYPRTVFNVTNDNDDDWTYSLGNDGTVSQIIATYFLLMRATLKHCKAGPDDLAEYPFDPDDLFASGEVSYPDADQVGFPEAPVDPSFPFTTPSTTVYDDQSSLEVRPQEKVVEETQSLTGGIQRLLQEYAPSWRFYWQPGERLWRFYEIQSSPAVTITANDANAEHPLLNMDLSRSLDGRYGAIKYYGPERIIVREAHWYASIPSGEVNSLIDVSNGPVLEYINAGTPIWGKNRWQIADPALRRVARKFADPITVPMVAQQWGNADRSQVYDLFVNWIETWSPSFQVRYSENNAGSDVWRAQTGWRLDARNGVVYFPSTCVYRWNQDPPAPGGISGPHYEPPIEAKLIYPSFDPPITVRYPSSGYSGTIYSVAGIENTLRQYDEMLAVGRVYNYPVTTLARLERFYKLAEQVHRQRKDISYSGGITVDGIVWDWAWLNRRVNLTAKNSSGGAMVTGWETMNAPMSDVEFDFNANTTTINFNSNLLEMIGINVEQLKARLKIRNAQLQYWFTWSTAFTTVAKYTDFGTPIVGQDVFVQGSAGSNWVDDQGGLQ